MKVSLDRKKMHILEFYFLPNNTPRHFRFSYHHFLAPFAPPWSNPHYTGRTSCNTQSEHEDRRRGRDSRQNLNMATDCVSNPTLMSPSKNIRVGSPCKYVPLEKWVHNSSADINFFAVRERRKEGRKEGREGGAKDTDTEWKIGRLGVHLSTQDWRAF